ncbi:hypothetical protein [Roseiflexus castenholzii]|uniref:hypothetical protein n=1 Tax=Roseiflexus castenholzii TaxID=120962 RepID=UPI003C7B8981
MNTKRTKSGIAGGIFLIGLGILIVTGGWYPGVLFVLGLAIGADRAFRGNYGQAVTALAVCFAIGLLSAVDLPWHIFGPFILISLGAVAVTQGILSKEG